MEFVKDNEGKVVKSRLDEEIRVNPWPFYKALREQAQLETVAIGDQYPARLVRARTATRLACYQHPRQMARDQAFDALLLAAPEAAEEVTTTAAVRGAQRQVGELVERPLEDEVRQGDGRFEGIANHVAEEAPAPHGYLCPLALLG